VATVPRFSATELTRHSNTLPALIVEVLGHSPERRVGCLNVYRLKGGSLRALLHPTALKNARRGPRLKVAPRAVAILRGSRSRGALRAPD
jgi:hypothetical protein